MQLIKNNAYSTLAGSLTNVATSMSVATGTGDRFPIVAGADFAMVTLQDASNNIEIVKVTVRGSGSDAMTIARAQEGTTARSWSIGDIVELRITAGGLAPLQVLAGATDAAGIRTAIGATATGVALFTAADAATARTAIGASATTSSFIAAADAATARTAIGALGVSDTISNASNATYASNLTSTVGAGVTGTTQAVNTNNTTMATTQFVLGQATSATPLAAAITAYIGSSMSYARGDHVHPEPVSNYQVFTSSGTWVKPSYGRWALIEAWGAGGGGTAYSSGGGGGGNYAFRLVPIGSLGATESVVIGSGGVGAYAYGGTSGAAGGDTSLGSWLNVKGGSGAGSALAGGGFGGGGGGGLPGSNYPDASLGGYGGGEGAASGKGKDAAFGGGGGGAGSIQGGTPGDGGKSQYGGGGGGGAEGSVGHYGGLSSYGGKGGDSPSVGGVNGGDGNAPGGGGGGCVDTSGNFRGGNGARGEVRVTVF